MSLFNNNLNDMMINKERNDFTLKLEDDKRVNIINGSKYTKSENIYNDPKGRLITQYSLFKNGNLPSFYYDKVFLQQVEQPTMVDEYGESLIAQRDMTLFNTLTKQPVNVSGYLVKNEYIKKYAETVSSKQQMNRNNFYFD